jgi:hypothetical protein
LITDKIPINLKIREHFDKMKKDMGKELSVDKRMGLLR